MYSRFLIIPFMALICSFVALAAVAAKNEVANLLSHFPGMLHQQSDFSAD
jgi:hypothetical protein